MSLAFAPGEAYYLPFAHRRPGELELDDRRLFNLPPLGSPEMRPLVAMLEDPAVAKVGQNLKYDLLVLRRAGVTLRGIAFDTMIASYVLDPGRREHGLDSLALQYLDHRTTTYEELWQGEERDPVRRGRAGSRARLRVRGRGHRAAAR